MGHYQYKCGRNHANDATSYRADATTKTRRDRQRLLGIGLGAAAVNDSICRHEGVHEELLRGDQNGILQIWHNRATFVAVFHLHQDEPLQSQIQGTYDRCFSFTPLDSHDLQNN